MNLWRNVLRAGVISGLLVCGTGLDAQDTAYARRIVESLSSQEFHGRGYVDDGDWKAAQFVAAEMRKQGVREFSRTAFQDFHINVNTFPGHQRVRVNGRALEPGRDFIVRPCSHKGGGIYKASYYDVNGFDDPGYIRKIRSERFEFSVPVLDRSKLDSTRPEFVRHYQTFFDAMHLDSKPSMPALIEVGLPRLIWGTGSEVCAIPIVQIRDSALLNEEINQIRVDILPEYKEKYLTQNVLGYIEGSLQPGSFILITSHYDHLGRLGPDLHFPGAGDACGVAMMLDLARHFAESGVEPKHSLAFIAFGGTEVDLAGSEFFVHHPWVKPEEIAFQINLEGIGFGDQGIWAVNGKEVPEEFNRLMSLNGRGRFLKEIRATGADRSGDHFHFAGKGVRAITIRGIDAEQRNNSIDDRPERLTFADYEGLFRLLAEFIQTF